jgi:hypothetical protein
MGAGIQRWWRDTEQAREPFPPREAPEFTADAIEIKLRSYGAKVNMPWWHCTGCHIISNAEWHACPQPPYYVFDMRGLRFLP